VNKITLDVKSNDLETVLLVLNNLKDGLIENIEVDKEGVKNSTAYNPKTNKVIYENEKLDGKYLNPENFKKRLRK